jgi:hypothetical protein
MALNTSSLAQSEVTNLFSVYAEAGRSHPAA